MSYSTREIWIPCDTLVNTDIAANTEEGITGEAISAITSGTAGITRGRLAGVQVTVSAADANNDGTKGFEIRLYRDTSKSQLLYSVFFTMTAANVGSACHATDMLATPMPFYEIPFFTQRTGASAATTLDTTVTFMIKAMA
jgi:hypothetical protein